jgi:hypothetical protein
MMNDSFVGSSSEALRARFFDSNLQGRKAHFMVGVYGSGWGLEDSATSQHFFLKLLITVIVMIFLVF